MDFLHGFTSTERADDPTEIGAPTSQSYRDFHISGNARVHNGNYQYIVNNVFETDSTPFSTAHERGTQEQRGVHVGRGAESHTLARSLRVLYAFSNAIPHTLSGQDAARISRHMSIVLHTLAQQSSGKDCGHTEDDLSSLIPDASRRVKIDGNANTKIPQQALDTLRERSTTTVGTAQISVDTTFWTQLDLDGRHVAQTISTLRFRPLARLSGSPFAICFGETVSHDSRATKYHLLIAYRAASRTSAAFEMVRRNDVHGLARSFAVGEATPRDHDEENFTLLYVSSALSFRYCHENRHSSVCLLLSQHRVL
jgi:hypothetical protein